MPITWMDIRKSLEFKVQLMIFLVVFIQLFLQVHVPEQANKVALAFSVLIGFYLIMYAISHQLDSGFQKRARFAQGALMLDLWLLGGLVICLASTSFVDNAQALVQQAFSAFTKLLMYATFFGVPSIVFACIISSWYAVILRRPSWLSRINSTIQAAIRKEQNIKIRERHETEMKYLTTGLFALLVAANLLSSWIKLYGTWLAVSLYLALSLLYFLIEFKYRMQYISYTDELIRVQARGGRRHAQR